MMSLSQVCHAVNGRLVGDDVMAHNVSINTRAECDGRLFVALKGDNFDAHEYVAQAEQAGAVAIMLERDLETTVPKVLVASTHQALKDLAAWWRQQFALPLLGVTGSVGKTTVKEMLRSITSELGTGVVTQGNLNNEIGVPLTLMRLSAQDQYAVIEMGMNHAGEIGRLTAIAKPTVALVNNAAAAHLEGLGTIAAVAKAKGEIFSGLSKDGIAVINVDDPFAPLWLELVADKRTLTFGLDNKAEVTATYQNQGSALLLAINAQGEEAELRLNSLGEHSVRNALAAISAALAANISLDVIIRGLEKYRPVKGRLNPIQLSGFTLFDDTYNANPASMQAAIRVLATYDNNLLIVGDMAELGDSCEAEHLALGQFAVEHGIDTLLACGRYAERVVEGFGHHGKAYQTQEALLHSLMAQPLSVNAVLVKGSRSASMENVVEALVNVYHLSTDVGKTQGDTLAPGVN